jgi:HEAT repeat protein
MPFVKQQPCARDDDQRRNVRDCVGLVRQLADPSPAARRWAVRDLAGCPDSSAALVDRLQHEQESSVREIILTTLTQLGDEQAVTGLAQFLRSEDVALRNEAIEAMKLLPDEVAPIMGKLLKDPDPDVRIFAVNVLESLRHRQVEEWLTEVIREDPHVNVCATAVDLLGEVGSSYSRGALEQLKVRFPDEPYISFAADLALKRITNT